jgi:hypothetical protein
MKKYTLCMPLFVSLMVSQSLMAEEAVAPAISYAEALKLGVDGLAAKRGDESEAGLDAAALYFATAKRMQTEQKLGAKDLSLVLDLERFREAAREWQDAWYEGIYYVSGGGTMWSHMQARSQAELEDTLEEFAKRMPLKPGNATVETLTQWGKLEKVIEKANASEDLDPDTKALWKAHHKVMHQKWERFHFEFQALDDADAQLLLKVLMPSDDQIDIMSGK